MNFEKQPEYYNNTRTELIDMLPSIQGRFLEVGCGTGSTLAYLKSKGASSVAGVDIDKHAVALAKQKGLDCVIAANIESEELPFAKNEFDCIILADVLEHLYNPWGALEKLNTYLKDNGLLLLSLPNIKHYTILKKLILSDEWTYSDIGILDNSHIRFFTRKAIKKILTDAGLEPIEIRAVVNAGGKFRLLNALFFNRLHSFAAVQYLIMAKKNAHN